MAKDKTIIPINDDMPIMERLIVCTGEVFGTAILVFLGCMGCVPGANIATPLANSTNPSEIQIIGNTHEQISLTFGLAVMVAVQVFGHISGSHINPIVTVTAVTLGNIPLMRVPVYFIGQLLGAILGFGLLKVVTPSIYLEHVCSPQISPNISVGAGFMVEFLITFILAWVCCGVWDPRNETKHDSVSIRFGFTIAVLAMAAGPYTGANMNPVRSFAPALFNGDWDNHWVYWVAPLSAGFAAGLIYRLIFTKPPPTLREQIAEGMPLNENSKA